MKYYVLVMLFTLGLIGCVSSTDKQKIAYQAARLDRAIALINSGSVTQKQEEDFIRGERAEWHALDYSINGNPLPADLQPKPAPAGK